MTKKLAKAIMYSAHIFDNWSLQGFGMLRIHVTDSLRLNIWDSRFRVPSVSLVHNHPWNFTSSILAGELTNIRYLPVLADAEGDNYHTAIIKPGPGGGIVTKGRDIKLCACKPEVYREGDTYSQERMELHISNPKDGTVTWNDRQRVGEDQATVCWLQGGEWISAEPRKATRQEIAQIIDFSLSSWFK